MIAAFDMDGVILASRATIIEAYWLAGVQAPPNIVELEGQPWLQRVVGSYVEAQRVRGVKDAYYAAVIRRGDVPLLPAWDAAFRIATIWQRPVWLLTGAGWDAIQALYAGVGRITWPFTLAAAKLTQRDKLDLFARMRERVVYVDDQPPKFTLPRNVRHVLYRSQSEAELIEEIVR